MRAPSSLASLLQRQWCQGGWFATLLRPLAALTGLGVACKRSAYLKGWRLSYRASVPVIVIGNVYVGGTGKTPVVMAITQALLARGFTPGVISRGYGVRIGAQPRVGQGELAADQYGDEPALIARTLGVPIAVHPRRAWAAQALLQQYPAIDVIVSDDGLQHLALARDIEIVVQDERGIGNGRLLPAGPLREPASRLQEVDAVVTHLSPSTPPPADRGAPPPGPRQIAMWLEPESAWNLHTGERRPLADFACAAPGKRLAAAAGIGYPERFFATLRTSGLHLVTTLSLSDHYHYARSPFTHLAADIIFITTKDAIKCNALQDPRLWVVPMRACFNDVNFFDWLAMRLRSSRPTARAMGT